MATMTENERVEIGARFNGEKLVQRAGELGKQAEQDGLKLPAGFLDRVKTGADTVKTMRQDQTVAKDDVPSGTAGQGEAFAALKDWVADAVEATDNAFEDDPEQRDRFHRLGAKIGRSVPRLLDRAVTLLPLLQDPKVMPAIAEWGFDAARLAEGDQLIAELRAADNTQEVAVNNLPGKSRDYYLAKGNLYLDLKRLSRRGRRHFAKDAARASAYVLGLRSSPRPRKTE